MAVALETARSLLAAGPSRNDVIPLFTDGEEPAPRFGSTAFVDDHPRFDDVRFIVNLEAIGTGGPSMVVETSGPQSWILDRLADSVPQPVAFSFLTETTALLGGSNTDFAPFRDAGVPGVEFALPRFVDLPHSSRHPDSVSRRSLHSHGDNTLGLIRHLAAEDLVTVGGADEVFFTVGRFHLMRYPTSWGIPIVVAAGVSLWTPFAGWRDTMGVSESYGALLGLAALATVVLVIPFKFGRRTESAPTAESVVLVWWCLGLLAALAAPGMSYLFAVPALVGAVALLLGFDSSAGSRRLAPAVLTVGAAMVLLMPAIDTFFQFAQPRPGNPDSQILPTVAVPVLLIALVIQLSLAFRPRPSPRAEHPA